MMFWVHMTPNIISFLDKYFILISIILIIKFKAWVIFFTRSYLGDLDINLYYINIYYMIVNISDVSS
jgi:hypothetical protein